MYRLQFLNGKFKGKRLTIQQGSLMIGRDPSCHLDLDDDDEVSRQHAVIELTSSGPVIRDLGAMNTLEVNFQRVKEHRLRHGDRIEVGRTVIEFLSGTSSAPPRRRFRFSKLQAFSFLSISVIILLQVLFVVLFPMWQKREVLPIDLSAPVMDPEAPTEAPASGAPVVVTTDAVSVPPPSARPPAAVAEPGAPTPSAAALALAAAEEDEDVRQVREEIGGYAIMSGTLEDRPERPPAMEADPIDPLLVKAREMLLEAQSEVRRMNYPKADSLLERAQILAPEFAPLWRERALLFERRGLLKEADAQWAEMMTMSEGTVLYEQAAAERKRLGVPVARREAPRPPGADSPYGAPAQRLGKRVRILSIDRERFNANEEFDEMRLVRITLRPRNEEGALNSADLKVVVHFYDRVEGTERVMPTRALVPREPLTVEGPWGAGESRSMTATYILKRGFRAQELAQLGERRTYEGYRVGVYYQGQLQDESAMPRRLLSLPMPPTPRVR